MQETEDGFPLLKCRDCGCATNIIREMSVRRTITEWVYTTRYYDETGFVTEEEDDIDNRNIEDEEIIELYDTYCDECQGKNLISISVKNESPTNMRRMISQLR